MDFNVYFDSKGEFLTRLVRGSQKGIDVGKWLESLYSSTLNQDSRYHPDATKVTINKVDDAFPCIIVIHKSMFRLWKKSMEKSLNMIEKILKIYEGLTDIEQKQGLWPAYMTYLDGEKSRLEKLKKVVDNHQENLEQHLQQQCSFFNNSSIWVRVVNWDDNEIEAAKKELTQFNTWGLYDYDSAKENLDYNIRLQPENYLDSKTLGHGVHVTPVLYGDEAESLNILRDNNIKIEYNN